MFLFFERLMYVTIMNTNLKLYSSKGIFVTLYAVNLKNRSLYVAWVWSACYYGVLITDQAAYANVLIKCSSCRARKRNANATYKSLAQTLLNRAICMREVAEKFCVDHWGKEIGIFQLLNEIMTLNLREYQKTLKTKDCKSRFSCAYLQGAKEK